VFLTLHSKGPDCKRKIKPGLTLNESEMIHMFCLGNCKGTNLRVIWYSYSSSSGDDVR